MSPLFKLNAKDLLRGLVVIVLSVLFSLPVSELAQYFPLLNNNIIALIVSTAFGYLGKNLLTDSEGKLGGILKIK